MIQIINGQVPSKSNSYIITFANGHPQLSKGEKLVKYEKSFYLQCNLYRNKNIKGLFQLKINIFNSSQRPDLDNCFKVFLDCLQTCKAIENDRNCIKIEAEKFVDKINPRIEFEIVELLIK